jgi:hypothetical protein
MDVLVSVLFGPLLLVSIAAIVIVAYLRERSTKPARKREKHTGRASQQSQQKMARERSMSKEDASNDPYAIADDGADDARGGRAGSDAATAAAAFAGGMLATTAVNSDHADSSNSSSSDGDSGDSGGGD